MRNFFLHINLKVALVLSLLFFISEGIVAQKLTLFEAIALAQEKSISKRKAETDLILAQNQLKIMESGLKPQLSLGATLPNFYKTSSAITQPDGTISFLPITQDNSSLNFSLSQRLLSTNTRFFAETQMRRYHDYSDLGLTSFNSTPFRIGIEQPLNGFNSLKWNQKIFGLEQESARLKLDINREEIATEVTVAYFDLLIAKTNLEIAQTNAENNQKIYEIALERDRLGKISRSDFLQLELSLNSSRQEILNARRELIRTNSRLREVMNLDLHDDAVLDAVAPENLSQSELDPSKAADIAWQRRPEHLDFRKQILEAEKALEQAGKENGWQATLFATLGYVGTGSQFSHSYQNPQSENMVQVGLSIPILDGGRRKYSIQSNQQNKNYIVAETEYQEQVFKQNVRQLALQFKNIREEVELGRKSLDIAGKRYEIANQRYVLNDISITDLGIAFNERDMAWRNYISLLRGYWVSYYTLRQLTLENF